jgi:hypothetical protein
MTHQPPHDDLPDDGEDFVLPDPGPVECIDRGQTTMASHALSRYVSVIRNGTPDREGLHADVMESDEVLIATYGDESVSTFRSNDDLIVEMAHKHGSEHLTIDADLVMAYGLIGDSKDTRLQILRIVEFARRVMEKASKQGIRVERSPDLLREITVSAAYGRERTFVIEHAVGPADAPVLEGGFEGPIDSMTARQACAEPLLCVDMNGGFGGANMTLSRHVEMIHAPVMDAIERLRIIAEHEAEKKA